MSLTGGIGLAILAIPIGTGIGALWAFAVGLGGGPGAAVTHRAVVRQGYIPTWGLILTAAGQLFVSLIWVAFVVESARSQTAPAVSSWPVWVAAWWIAGVPTWAAVKDAAQKQPDERTVQDGAIAITAPLAAAGFFVFVLFPSVLKAAWGWVPHF